MFSIYFDKYFQSPKIYICIPQRVTIENQIFTSDPFPDTAYFIQAQDQHRGIQTRAKLLDQLRRLFKRKTYN